MEDPRQSGPLTISPSDPLFQSVPVGATYEGNHEVHGRLGKAGGDLILPMTSFALLFGIAWGFGRGYFLRFRANAVAGKHLRYCHSAAWNWAVRKGQQKGSTFATWSFSAGVLSKITTWARDIELDDAVSRSVAYGTVGAIYGAKRSNRFALLAAASGAAFAGATSVAIALKQGHIDPVPIVELAKMNPLFHGIEYIRKATNRLLP